MFGRILVALFLVTVSACAGGARPIAGGNSQVQVVQDRELPAPDRADFALGDRTYYIGPYDTLLIDVFGIEELKEREIQVDSSGSISFPLAGTISVDGRTPAEVRQMIEQRLGERYMRRPQVTVNLKEIVSQLVTVEGQVRKPGQYPVAGRMTLLRAIARAEGTDEFAKLSQVVVFRTVRGQKMAALYDVRAIRQGNYEDPQIYPNDVVVVGEARGRRLFKDLIGVAPLLTTPLVVLLQK